MLRLLWLCLAAAAVVQAVLPGVGTPHEYPGLPNVTYNPAWQEYFQVTSPLPNVTFDLPRNWAGNLPVQRRGSPDDALFFWGFEHEDGSLTAAAGENNDAPWAIWLNGGPGSSSMAGLFFENGPLRILPDDSVVYNNWSWHNLMDYFWVDQPVGVGYSTAESDGFVTDEDQIGEDFLGFLENLVTVFPSLATRPFYLTGESYGGRFISYIAKAYFQSPNPPVKLAHILLGDPALGSNDEFKTLPALSIIETYPQLIGYDTDVYDYFKEQSQLCNFTTREEVPYPGNGPFPPVDALAGRAPDHNIPNSAKRDLQTMVKRKRASHERAIQSHHLRPSPKTREQRKRDLTGRANGTIDPWYGCSLWDELVDYAANFTFPWTHVGEFDAYDIPDAMNPDTVMSASSFLDEARDAIHAPHNKDWARSIDYPWNSVTSGGDPSIEPMAFLTELASNMSAHGIPMSIYSGNDDGISPHFGTEITIQNTTFGGVQGFTRKPSTPWFDDLGKWAGIIHQERSWTYALFDGAGHQGPYFRPAAFYRFVRDFVLGDDQTGLVTSSDTPAVGGEDAILAQGIIPGQAEILYGAATKPTTTTYPDATVSAFMQHVGISFPTFTTAVSTPTSTTAGTKHNAASPSLSSTFGLYLLILSLSLSLTLPVYP